MSAPVCPRCPSTRFFHVTRVMEHGAPARVGQSAWTVRPVGVVQADAPPSSAWHPLRHLAAAKISPLDDERHEPVGHFETIVCRDCGHTTWFAHDWATLVSSTRLAACRGCARTTPHAQREAVEARGHGYEPVRLTRGLLGREGFVDLELCTACGLATWQARQYLHVTDRAGVHRYVTDTRSPCLACHGTRALVVESAREVDGSRVPVALHHTRLLRFFDHDASEGRFSLRVCTACNAIEWTAQRLDEIEVDPAQGVFALGDAPAISAAGPYR